MRLSALVLATLLLAAPAFAADVDGKWSGSIDTPNGAVQIGYTFKADGAALTGTTTGPDGMEVAIKNGKIDGDKISFLVSVDFGGMPLDLNYKGVVAADQIKLSMEFPGAPMPIELTVKKSN